MTRRRFRTSGPLLSDEARELLAIVTAIGIGLVAAFLNAGHPDGPRPESDLQPAPERQAPETRAAGPQKESR